MTKPGTALRRQGAAAPQHVQQLRPTLGDGSTTTVHVATYDRTQTEVRVALVKGQQLSAWCAAAGVSDAVVGGFFARPHGDPLGEVRTRGVLRKHVPFDDPWCRLRSCVHVDGMDVTIGRRYEIEPEPRGDLLQAGPLLVRDGEPIFDRRIDSEGFSAGAGQFDSDITAERHPRAALAVAGERLLAVVCDGRSDDDAGLTLEEFAVVLAGLGADAAINLDGGGSATLVAGGRMRNTPRAAYGVPEPGGRGIATALLFLPR